jgi:hypothetical protein
LISYQNFELLTLPSGSLTADYSVLPFLGKHEISSQITVPSGHISGLPRLVSIQNLHHCFIALTAVDSNALLLTLDKHFTDIGRFIALKYQLLTS